MDRSHLKSLSRTAVMNLTLAAAGAVGLNSGPQVIARPPDPDEISASFVGHGGSEWSRAASWTPRGAPRNTSRKVYSVTIGSSGDVNWNVKLDISTTINDITIDENNALSFIPGHNLMIKEGGVANSGTINIDSTGVTNFTTQLRFLGTPDPDDNTPEEFTIDGGGVINMKGAGARISGTGPCRFTNSDNIIQGGGYIGGGSFGFVNEGLIIANDVDQSLTIHAGWLAGQVEEGDPLGFDNSSGTIQVNQDCTLIVDSARDSFLSFDRANSELSGNYVLDGTFQFRDAKVHTLSGDLTFTTGFGRIQDLQGNDALRSFSRITEDGVVQADRANFSIDTHEAAVPFVNLGLIYAHNGGRVYVVNDTSLDNFEENQEGRIVIGAAGQIDVGYGNYVHGGSIELGELDDDANWRKGQLNLRGDGHIGNGLAEPTDATLHVNERSEIEVFGENNTIEHITTIAEKAEVNIFNNSRLTFVKRYDAALDNDGTITVGDDAPGKLHFDQPIDEPGERFFLIGDGTIVLKNSEIGGNYAQNHLVNIGNTIRGSGSIGVGSLAFDHLDGIIRADQSQPLTLNASNCGFRNQADLEVAAGSAMIINNADGFSFGSVINNSSFVEGRYVVSGTLKIQNFSLVNNIGGDIVLDGPNSQILDFAGSNALRNYNFQDRFGTFTVSGGRQYFVEADQLGGFTNIGVLNAATGGILTIRNGVFSQKHQQVPGLGEVVAQSGGKVQITDSDFRFGDLVAEPGGTVEAARSTLTNVTVYTQAGGTFHVSDGVVPLFGDLNNLGTTVITPFAALSLGDFPHDNEGVISVLGDVGPARLWMRNFVDLSGAGGRVQMKQAAVIEGDPSTNNNVLSNSNAIRGSGTIDMTRMELDNFGSIFGTDPSSNLQIETAGKTLTNFGAIGSADGGTLIINGGSVNNAGIVNAIKGVVLANQTLVTGGDVRTGAGGEIQLNNATISAVISNNAGGSIRALSGTTNTLGGSIQNRAGATISIDNGATLDVAAGASVANGGVFAVNSSNAPSLLRINGNTTFFGGGVVELNGANSSIVAASPNDTLTNADNTIRGNGIIEMTHLELTNQGSILGSRSSSPLRLQTTGKTINNSGTLGSSDGGTLVIDQGSVANSGLVHTHNGIVVAKQTVITGGNVQADAGGELQLDNSHIANAVTTNNSGGSIRALAGTSNTVGGAIRNLAGATVSIDNGALFNVAAGTDFRNSGMIGVNSPSAVSTLRINGNTTLYGGGVVELRDANARLISGAPTDTLTNADNTIRGGGAVGNGSMNLLNRGKIQASSTSPLVVDTGTQFLTNEGVFRAEAGSLLQAPSPLGRFTNFTSFDSTITGGTYDIAGKFQFTGASIARNRADIILDGPAAIITDESNNDALVVFHENAAEGRFTVINGHRFNASGSLSNAGTVTVGFISEIALPELEEYRQSAGLTRVDGLLTAHFGVFIDGGILDGVGTIDGPVTIQTGGQFNPGHSPTLFTILGPFENTDSGIVNMELGGLVLGTDFDSIFDDDFAILDGTMNVSLIREFQPSLGDAFMVMSYTEGFAGMYANMNLPELRPGLSWRVDYNPNDLTLVVVPEPVSGAVFSLAVLMGSRRRRNLASAGRC